MKKRSLLLLLLLALSSLVAILPQAKSITISQTIVVCGGDSDGYVARAGLVYESNWDATTAGSLADTATQFYIGQYISAPSYIIDRACLFFDTSSIPDNAIITYANLSLYTHVDSSTQDFNVTVQNGQPTYPHDPLVFGDYFKDWYSGDGGQWNSSSYVAGYINITLNAYGRSWIQKATTTKLMLRSSRDISCIAPVVNEYLRFRAFEHSGSACAPKLYITYEVEGWHLHVHGPFFESGLVAPYVVNVTLAKLDAVSYSFLLDGAAGADLVEINCTTQPISLAWNITSPMTNKTRTMYISDLETFQEMYIFIPNDGEPYYLYEFVCTDFAGISNAFLQTRINVNGTNRVVECFSLEVINSIPFWMTWSHTYDIWIVCDLGSYNYGAFIALNEQSQQIIITKDMFPSTYPGQDLTIAALRKNATWIQVNYTDNDVLTVWLQVIIRYRSGSSYVNAYTTNNTGNTQQINWYAADEDIDYQAYLTANRGGSLYHWAFMLAKTTPTNPWSLLEGLGDFPFPVENAIGFFIVLFFFGAFSYASTEAGVIAGTLIALFLIGIGWLTISWVLGVLALVFAVLVALQEAKKKEREI